MPDYYFSLPAIDDLNDFQKQAALDEKCITLSGGPGTGKSVVSLWRHILNHEKRIPVKSQLLTFTTTLALYLKKCCETKSPIGSQYVDSCNNWYINNRDNREEIIVDEAQDMPLHFYKTQLPFYTRKISYGADDQQLIAGSAIRNDGTFNLLACSPESELRKLFSGNLLHRLARNYRSTLRIMLFVRELFKDNDDFLMPNEILVSLKNRQGELPRVFFTSDNLKKQNQSIVEIIRSIRNRETINIAILTPFSSYHNMEHFNARYYYKLLKDTFDCSYYTNELIKCQEIKNIHITTFKSAKGLEFDHVIIPNFHLYNERFDVVTWKDFYVGLTRSKSGLYLLSNKSLNNIDDSFYVKVNL
jgi:superfamily I DNA/RNA helicase